MSCRTVPAKSLRYNLQGLIRVSNDGLSRFLSRTLLDSYVRDILKVDGFVRALCGRFDTRWAQHVPSIIVPQ